MWFTTNVEKPEDEVLMATEPEEVEEFEGDEAVGLLSFSEGDFSLTGAVGLRRPDACALRK